MSRHRRTDNIPIVSFRNLCLEDPLDGTDFVVSLAERWGNTFQHQTSQGLTYLGTRPDLVHRALQEQYFRRATPLSLARGNGLPASKSRAISCKKQSIGASRSGLPLGGTKLSPAV